ncbi:J domain-containing protein [bacterium]|nr:J domain-containing protein [bacterium]
MVTANYYEILDLETTASEAEIKQAFRRLARKYHPDSAEGAESVAIFQQVTEAYDVLSDPESRARYDRTIGVGDAPKVKTFEQSAAANPNIQSLLKNQRVNNEAPKWTQFKPEDPKDHPQETEARQKHSAPKSKSSGIFDTLKSKLSNKGKSPLTAEGVTKPATHKSTDVEHLLRGQREYIFTIDALESVIGTTRDVVYVEDDQEKTIRVKIPAGIREGQRLNVAPTSEFTVRVKIEIVAHDFLERDGEDLTLHVPITISEALLQKEIIVQTLDGEKLVKLPRLGLDRAASTLTLRGAGLLHKGLNRRGDLHLRPFVVCPSDRPDWLANIAGQLDTIANGQDLRSALPQLKKL